VWESVRRIADEPFRRFIHAFLLCSDLWSFSDTAGGLIDRLLLLCLCVVCVCVRERERGDGRHVFAKLERNIRIREDCTSHVLELLILFFFFFFDQKGKRGVQVCFFFFFLFFFFFF
jgi:hypothetical protein